MSKEKEYLTVAIVAERINKSPRTVQRLCRQGKIGSSQPDGSRGYLIPLISLEEYLKIRR